jgi:hypothetical protein
VGASTTGGIGFSHEGNDVGVPSDWCNRVVLHSRDWCNHVVLHSHLMWYVMKVRKNTSSWVVCREAGMYPVQHRCLHHMLKFLSTILQLMGVNMPKLLCLTLYCR